MHYDKQPDKKENRDPFDIAECRKAFPDFRYTSLDEGLARARNESREPA